MMNFRDVKDLTKEDILGAIGLAPKATTSDWLLGSLGIFGLGILVGAGTALLLAPKTGRELRGDLGQRLARRKIDDPILEGA